MKLIVPDAAQTELEKARDYYLEHARPRIAAAFAEEYEQSVLRLLEYPLTGAPDLASNAPCLFGTTLTRSFTGSSQIRSS